MTIASNLLLAFSMSADAFAAALSKGVSMPKPRLRHAMRIGMIFGAVETITPLLGWLLGRAASNVIASVDHWVAFGILSLIGCKMLYESVQKEREETKKTHSLRLLIFTAIGTSIDAMAVGATLAFIDANIVLVAAMIGCATFLMVTLGIMTGHYIGTKAGRYAEALGGVCLIAIGTSILMQHLSGAA